MIYALIGIIVGILAGWFLPFTIQIEFTRYTAVVILGIVDAIIGAIRAELAHDSYDPLIFTSGLFFNILLALGITLFGDFLGLDLYLAATVVFTFRIFRNVGMSRRVLFDKYLKKHHYHDHEQLHKSFRLSLSLQSQAHNLLSNVLSLAHSSLPPPTTYPSDILLRTVDVSPPPFLSCLTSQQTLVIPRDW